MMRAVLDKVFPWLWAAVWFTLPLSMKASGACLIFFGLAAVAHAFYYRPVFDQSQVLMACLFVLLFFWHALSLAFDPETFAAWKSLERKFSLALIPVLMLLVSGTREDLGKWAIRGFFAGLLVTGFHMLVLALLKMMAGQPAGTFTYHEFTGPYSLGPIYYSCYLSIAVYYLAFRKQETFIEKIRLPLGIFFLILLLFCASKLMIVLTLPALIFTFTRYWSKEKGLKRLILPAVVLIVIIAGSVPFFNRISELKNTDLSVVSQDRYRYDTPLNGVTYRMILWRFAGEIMQEEKAWLTGTGIGSRQEVLNSYYIKYGIYTGNPDLGDTGYLGYNFHNQYLEVMVGTGIPGLILLLSIIILKFFQERSKLFFPSMVYIAILIFFITESVLERQAGIVFFCLVWTLQEHTRQKVEL